VLAVTWYRYRLHVTNISSKVGVIDMTPRDSTIASVTARSAPAPLEMRPRVVILGAGYAGLAAAHAIGRQASKVALTVVDRNPYHTMETLLHEAAAHARQVTIPLAPLLSPRRATLHAASVTRVDLDARKVHTDNGVLRYDQLIIALGSVTNFFRIPGLREHAIELKSADDAARVHAWLTRAHQPDWEGSRDVLVGGGGLSGVELAAELAVSATRLAADKGVPAARVTLIEAGPDLLPGLDEGARRHARERLEARGVNLRLGVRVTAADSTSLHLSDGSTVPGGLIVWTGGVRAPDLVTGEHLERGAAGRLVVTRQLELRNYPGVFVAGDIALAVDPKGEPVPTTAQHAAQQGHLAARNAFARLTAGPLAPYNPSTLGELVSLGGLLGVGWVRLPWRLKLRLTGSIAGLVKRASEWRHELRARGLLPY
jgi:NADH dehydrogenase